MNNSVVEYEGFGALDSSDPNSIISRIPANAKTLREAIVKASEAKGYEDIVLEKDWKEQYKHSKDYKVMRYLRISFWQEYQKALALDKELTPQRIHAGVCSNNVFNRLMRSEDNCVYLFTQPQQLRVIQEDLINIGYEQIYQVLEMDNMDKDGNPNVKLIKEKREFLELLQARKDGSVIQRSQIHQKNETTHKTENTDESSIDDLKKELMRLKEELSSDTNSYDDFVADYEVVSEE